MFLFRWCVRGRSVRCSFFLRGGRGGGEEGRREEGEEGTAHGLAVLFVSCERRMRRKRREGGRKGREGGKVGAET